MRCTLSTREGGQSGLGGCRLPKSRQEGPVQDMVATGGQLGKGSLDRYTNDAFPYGAWRLKEYEYSQRFELDGFSDGPECAVIPEYPEHVIFQYQRFVDKIKRLSGALVVTIT